MFVGALHFSIWNKCLPFFNYPLNLLHRENFLLKIYIFHALNEKKKVKKINERRIERKGKLKGSKKKINYS